MRKIFTLFAAMLFAVVANAADQYPDPKVTNSLAAAFSAVGNGETVYLDDSATYVNIKGNDYTYIQEGKSFTVKAKDGENPVIRFAVPFRILEASSAKFIGIKFEVDSMKSYDNLFYFKDSTNNTLEFENCEFTGASSAVSIISVPSKYMAASIVMKDCYFHHNANRAVLNQGTLKKLTIIDSKFFKFTGSDHPVIDNYGSGISEKYQIEGCEFDSITEQVVRGGTGAHLDSCIIDNSIFLNSANSAVKFPQTGAAFHACNVLKVSNSTFANFKKLDASLISFANKSGTEVKDAELRVDHCTFYNLELVNASYTYGFIDSRKSSNALVSNCIFANPTAGQSYATYCYGAAVVDTCLIYNTNGHKSSNVVTGGISSDPLFQDAANGDFTLSYGSPALTAGKDNSAIGDPRWVPNFYLTGTAAGATDAWTGHEIACAGTSYTIKNLAAGSYQLKLTRNGTWDGDNNVYGYDALSAKIGGLYRGTGDANDNICFTLADAGDVKVTFIYDEPLVFKVEGDFVMQKIQLVGSWKNDWTDLKTFEPVEDKLTATLTMHFTSNYYEFKVVENDTWNGKWAGEGDAKYYYTRTVTSASNFEKDKNNLVITPDVEGDYVFTWTYATRVLTVAYPAAPDTVYCLAGSMLTDGDWGEALAPMTNTAGIWSKTVNITKTTGLSYKIVRVTGLNSEWYGLASSASMKEDDCTDWVIGGGEAAIGITTDETGDYTFNYNPAEKKVSLIYPSAATAIDETNVGEKAVKVIRNGQLFIEKNGKTYNILGTVVK